MEMYVVMRLENNEGSPELRYWPDSICVSWGAAVDRVKELRSIDDRCRALGDPKSYFWFRKVPVAATTAELTNFAKYRS